MATPAGREAGDGPDSEPGAGRPRDPAIDSAVREATLTLLRERGYANLSIGEVARAAGVPRPAIYRRWPSKRHLVVDVLAETIGANPTPDTGNLRRDLVKGIDTIRSALTDKGFGVLLPALVADLDNDNDLRTAFLGDVFIARRDSTEKMLRSAMERGEVRADVDMQFILDTLAAPLYFRALFQHAPIDRRLVEQTVDSVLAGIVVDRETT